MDRHFPKNSMTPLVLFIQSSHDLRTPNALADLEQIAGRVSQLPDITMVRGLTRPNGEPLEQTKVSFQAGEVGSKLDEAASQIQNHGGDLDKLVNGADQLADALAQMRDSGHGGSYQPQRGGLGPDDDGATDGRRRLDQHPRTSGPSSTGRMKSLGDNLNASTVDAQNIAGWASPDGAGPQCQPGLQCRSRLREFAGRVGVAGYGR